MTKYCDIKYGNHDNSIYIEFTGIRIDLEQECKKYNALMNVEIKNDFLSCKLMSATFHSINLFDFFNGIEEIYTNLSGDISLQSVEENCYLTVRYFDNGYIHISGLLSKTGEHNICDFEIDLDQTCFANKSLHIVARND